MSKPSLEDRCRNLKFLQGFLEDLPSAREMTAHDGIFAVGSVERSALIFNGRTQKLPRMLIFHFFDPLAISLSKKETDHTVSKYPVDKNVNNLA